MVGVVGRSLAQSAVAPTARGQMPGAPSGEVRVEAEARGIPVAGACRAVRPGDLKEGTDVDPGAATRLAEAGARARAAGVARAGAAPAGAEVAHAAEASPGGAESGPGAASMPAGLLAPLGFGTALAPRATPGVHAAWGPGRAWDLDWAPDPGWAWGSGSAPDPGSARARLRSWQSQCRFEATGVEVRPDDGPTQQLVVEQSASQRLDVVRRHGSQGLDHLVHRHHSVVHRLLATQE